MEQVPNILEDTSNKMRSLVKRSDKFLTKDSDLYEKTKLFSKVLYDVTKLIELEPSKATLPELIIEDFDPEQVWAGVEMQNQQKFSKLQSKFSSLNLGDVQSQSLLFGKPSVSALNRTEDTLEDQDEEEEEEDVEDDDSEEIKENDEDSNHSDEEKSDDDILNDPDFQNMSDSDGDDLPLFDNLDEDELNDDDDDEDEGGKVKTKKKLEDSGGGRKTEVDDQFFKLSDMEKFLDHEDKRELKKDKNRTESDSEDEEDVDLFEEMSGDEDMKYQDYFGKQETVAGDILEEGGESDEDEEDDDNEDQEDEEEEGNTKTNQLLPSSDEEEEEVAKSSHEVSQERLARKISRLEEAAVGEKAWQMGGEVSAPVRPENSLLSEHLEYDSAARQAPVITENVSRRLEDIILQRIKDKAWDDVERKVKPVEDPLDYKKKLVLDQEKSKLSLAQIYEEEYLKMAEEKTQKKTSSVGLLDKEEEETPGEVVEIRSMMNSLFRKLDSLSHLHFTPKQKSAELKIVRNIPSIAMEEVAPVAATNAVLLAPEEVVDKKKGELMDDREKTKTDRKRDKREKKAKLKAKIKDKERKEKLVAKINPGLGNKYSKEKALKKLEEAEKQGQVINLNKREKDHSTKNSKTFFSSLQEEVKTHVREKASDKKRRDKSKHINVASLKL